MGLSSDYSALWSMILAIALLGGGCDREAPPAAGSNAAGPVAAGGEEDRSEAGRGDSARSSLPAAAGGRWETYRHPLGPYFDRPGDWQMRENELGLLLIPGDFRQGEEFILAFGDQADGVTKATDARVGAYLDQAMGQLEPGLKRSGEPTAAQARGIEGAVYTWKGTAASGKEAVARIYVAILDRHAVAIAAIATPEQMRRRQATLDRMFSTLGMGQPQRDAQLVGSWRRSQSEFSGGASGSVGVNSSHQFTFNADGTVAYRHRASMSASSSDSGGGPGVTGSSQGGDIETGSWVAAAGQLVISWDNGNETAYAYTLMPAENAVRLVREGEGQGRVYRRE